MSLLQRYSTSQERATRGRRRSTPTASRIPSTASRSLALPAPADCSMLQAARAGGCRQLTRGCGTRTLRVRRRERRISLLGASPRSTAILRAKRSPRASSPLAARMRSCEWTCSSSSPSRRMTTQPPYGRRMGRRVHQARLRRRAAPRARRHAARLRAHGHPGVRLHRITVTSLYHLSLSRDLLATRNILRTPEACPRRKRRARRQNRAKPPSDTVPKR